MANTLYTTYLPLKSLISAGVIALQILPLNADYVHDAFKGISAGLQYTVSFVGAAISAVFIYFLTAWGLSASYYGVGMLLVAGGVLNSFLLKPGNKYYLKRQAEEDVKDEGQKDCKQHLSQIWKHISEVPWISIAIVTSALTYADVYLVTGITLWMQGLTGHGNYDEATRITTRYQMIFAGCSFISSLVYGFTVQKVDLFKFIMTLMLISLGGFVFVLFVDGPDSVHLYLLFALEGLTLPGVFLFSTFCAIRYNPPRYRGTLAGFGLIFGMIGAICILVLGGILYDKGIYESAFLLYCVLLVVVLVMVVVIYVVVRNRGTARTGKERVN